ncbi:hypothetical protein F4808DRAFT_249818 [Astrocystis sublimbata]|nr:hypothetical protein F4808DRAFT_249818 [Astrocystis sublimbata]
MEESGGYECGHTANEYPIPPILCRRQTRYLHEPMCTPPRFNIRLTATKYCEQCRAYLTEANNDWSERKFEWRKKGYLPEPVIQQLDVDRLDAMVEIFKNGIKMGPSHIEGVRIGTINEVIRKDADEQAKKLTNIKSTWEDCLRTLREQGHLTEDEIKHAEGRKKEAEKKYERRVHKLPVEVVHILDDLVYQNDRKKHAKWPKPWEVDLDADCEKIPAKQYFSNMIGY